MYLVETGHKAFDILERECKGGIARFGSYEAVNGRAYGSYKLWGYEFKLRRCALSFAIWASAWVTAYCAEGEVVIITPQFKL